MARRGFTLVELLVVIAVVAVLVGILLPVLASAREGSRAAVCQSNLRQIAIVCRSYADDHRGVGPAIGQPYAALPNWALVVQEATGRPGSGPSDLYSANSVLVCPTIRSVLGPDMQRTYAMNGTGHAGAPAFAGSAASGTRPALPPAPPDPDNYDDAARPAFIRFDLVQEPSGTVLLVDSAPGPQAPGSPPPTRTASIIDFRNDQHVAERLGLYHGRRDMFMGSRFDLSVGAYREPPWTWRRPLP